MIGKQILKGKQKQGGEKITSFLPHLKPNNIYFCGIEFF